MVYKMTHENNSKKEKWWKSINLALAFSFRFAWVGLWNCPFDIKFHWLCIFVYYMYARKIPKANFADKWKHETGWTLSTGQERKGRQRQKANRGCKWKGRQQKASFDAVVVLPAPCLCLTYNIWVMISQKSKYKYRDRLVGHYGSFFGLQRR